MTVDEKLTEVEKAWLEGMEAMRRAADLMGEARAMLKKKPTAGKTMVSLVINDEEPHLWLSHTSVARLP